MFLTALVTAAALSGPAATQTAPSSPAASPLAGTRAGELARRFQAASAPTAEDGIRGWTAGRCFMVATPDQAEANLLVYEHRETNVGNAGPIFNHPTTKMVVVTHGEATGNPELFDNMASEMVDQVRVFIDGVFSDASYSDVFAGDNAFSSTYGATRYDARTDGQYFYLRLSTKADNTDWAYCYFFKKVR